MKLLRGIGFLGCLLLMQCSLASVEPYGISGNTPGFPPEGYRDYLYIQEGTHVPFLQSDCPNVRSLVSTLIGTFVIFADGTVSGFGCSPCYVNPSGDFPENPVSTRFDIPKELTNIALVAASSWKYFIFLQKDGHVLGWGDTNFAFGRQDVPVEVTNAVAVSAGYSHAVALLESGSVVAWGGNAHGQTNVPSSVSCETVEIAAGDHHTLALLQDGHVVAWGMNQYGQSTVPDQVTNACSVAAGGGVSMALLANGDVVVWGCDWNGQTNVPPLVSNAVAISIANEHCIALLENGSFVVWGGNSFGQLDVPAYVSGAIGVSSGYDFSAALLPDGSASVWGGWRAEEIPQTPLSVIGLTLDCRVLQTAYSGVCEPPLLTAIVRAPIGSLESDGDFDGLTLFDELFAYGTSPETNDSDLDGLSDSEELFPLLTLWSASNSLGQVIFGGYPVDVVASDSARAALMGDGWVNIYTESGSGLLAYTNACDAVKLDASDNWIAALTSSGDVKIWRELAAGGIAESSMGYTNVVELSGGHHHLLLRHENGRVTCLQEGAQEEPQVYASSWVTAVTNAIKISAGSGGDAVLLANRAVRFGNALTTTSTLKTFTGTLTTNPVDVAAGSNRVYAVLFETGAAAAFKQSSNSTYETATGVVAIAAGGDTHLLAVKSNGSNLSFNSTGSTWSSSLVTNDLLNAQDLWWCRNSRAAVSPAGALMPMLNAVDSARSLIFSKVAVSPGGSARGIAIVYTGTSATNKYSDADSMPDGWEIAHGLNPMDASDASQDMDGDGLANSGEFEWLTDPRVKDSDGDGQEDKWEVDHGRDPAAPDDYESDLDGDGLTLYQESLLGTNPDLADSDHDGLNDGAEGHFPFLSLWAADGKIEKVITNCVVEQVTATDSARAARLAGGTVLVFRGSAETLSTYTSDCGAVDIDATESWVVARLADGGVRVFCHLVDGSLVESDPGLTNIVDVSAGYSHFLAMQSNGKVFCLKKDATGMPALLTNTFCTVVGSSAVKISAGTACDIAMLSNGQLIFGDVFRTDTPSRVTPPYEPVGVYAGSNRYSLVECASGIIYKYYPGAYAGPVLPGVKIAAGGSREMVAVLSNGRNAVATSGNVSWSYTTETNDLLSAKNLWWKRDSRIAVTAGGALLPLAAASSSAQVLDYRLAAVTPRGLALGIAAACSGTCPTNSDVDADGLLDGWEVGNGFNPRDPSDVLLDSDADEMPDWWEIYYGLNRFDPSDKTADADGDGVVNVLECERETDPRDALSCLRTLYADSDVGMNALDGYSRDVESTWRGPKLHVQQVIEKAISGDAIELRGPQPFSDALLSPGGKSLILMPVGSVRF